MVKVAACEKCAWTNAELRKALKTLRKAHPESLRVKKGGCLDACKKRPAVRVGKKVVAPATPKKIRRRIEKKLGG